MTCARMIASSCASARATAWRIHQRPLRQRPARRPQWRPREDAGLLALKQQALDLFEPLEFGYGHVKSLVVQRAAPNSGVGDTTPTRQFNVPAGFVSVVREFAFLLKPGDALQRKSHSRIGQPHHETLVAY